MGSLAVVWTPWVWRMVSVIGFVIAVVVAASIVAVRSNEYNDLLSNVGLHPLSSFLQRFIICGIYYC
jgi:hypothetical protein